MSKNKRIEVRLKNTWPISIFRKTSPKIDNREKKKRNQERDPNHENRYQVE